MWLLLARGLISHHFINGRNVGEVGGQQVKIQVDNGYISRG